MSSWRKKHWPASFSGVPCASIDGNSFNQNSERTDVLLNSWGRIFASMFCPCDRQEYTQYNRLLDRGKEINQGKWNELLMSSIGKTICNDSRQLETCKVEESAQGSKYLQAKRRDIPVPCSPALESHKRLFRAEWARPIPVGPYMVQKAAARNEATIKDPRVWKTGPRIASAETYRIMG